ncbi:hypothetical protein, partial [Alteromonas sp. 14N.309.X.WAT.G.H12]|uniref:hypothetical protein n=1 Tax=Alteromonas sp. 14N.309.X.WAT.G.H12 TaxID=3120824 RepID=UPI002FD4B4BC
ATAEAFAEDVNRAAQPLRGKPWAAIMDGRRWVLSTPDCQNILTEAVANNISMGLVRSAYVLETGMVKRAQLERTHPHLREESISPHYERAYFSSYLTALCWLEEGGFTPYPSK